MVLDTLEFDLAHGRSTHLVLGPRERKLIALLAKGYGDATAARRLCISRRSVTYALRTLMDQLGVENRFKLGLALGALGSITPSSSRPSHPDEKP